MHKILSAIFSLLFTLTVFASSPSEVRAVWLTTNGGLDWPGKIMSEAGQKKAMKEMLDRLKDANFNLVIFQVQANGDVLWNSSVQPAMEAVTGDASKPLSYDVCRFVIDECHARGMECHAWIVPFRIGSRKFSARYSANRVKHPSKSHPQLCLSYKGVQYLDPGNTETRKYLLRLYRELVEKYDFDGINLDYTRYPGNDFPDSATYAKRKDKKQSRDDWRRQNINYFVAEFYEMAKSLKPDIMVGSAPIGTYKNVENYRNATAYDTFQQDPGQWITSGRHDLVIPQMYWDEKAGFSAHLNTWRRTALPACHLVVGLAPYRMMDSGWSVDQIVSQITKVRKSEGVEGVCFFRAEHVLGNHAKAKALYNVLKSDIFKYPADLPWRMKVVGDNLSADDGGELSPFLQ
ncbi:MAG: family 10 glycosylhydrolase [Muribaculum sp.]|nr:family 10 glycosylhydrolase [Muribaculum sp.]